jgi:hypothetical protein
MHMTTDSLEPIELGVIGSSQTTVRAMPPALEPGPAQIAAVTFPGTVIEKRATLSLTAADAEGIVGQITMVLRAGSPDMMPARKRQRHNG